MLILASQSPRRREIMRLIAPKFEIRPSSHEAPLDTSLPAGEAVARIALGKARDIAAEAGPEDTVVAADTLVFLGGAALGKPSGPEEAREMLRALSGREHTVVTGMAVISGGRELTDHVATDVKFLPLDSRQIDWYVSTGEPLDKAGAYGIQGRGGLLVEWIRGDYYNVVGLPAARLTQMLGELGYRVFDM